MSGRDGTIILDLNGEILVSMKSLEVLRLTFTVAPMLERHAGLMFGEVVGTAGDRGLVRTGKVVLGGSNMRCSTVQSSTQVSLFPALPS